MDDYKFWFISILQNERTDMDSWTYFYLPHLYRHFSVLKQVESSSVEILLRQDLSIPHFKLNLIEDIQQHPFFY